MGEIKERKIIEQNKDYKKELASFQDKDFFGRYGLIYCKNPVVTQDFLFIVEPENNLGAPLPIVMPKLIEILKSFYSKNFIYFFETYYPQSPSGLKNKVKYECFNIWLTERQIIWKLFFESKHDNDFFINLSLTEEIPGLNVFWEKTIKSKGLNFFHF